MKYIITACMCLAIFCLAFTINDNTITGTVTDQQGQPVSGATVQVRGSKNATVTDSLGRFSITISGKNATLLISFVGFETKEITAIAGTPLVVALSPSLTMMQEVVITGYATRKAKSVTGSVATADQLLKGSVAGVAIYGNRSYNEGAYAADEVWTEPDYPSFNTEGYGYTAENPFLKVRDNPLSTFSIDVDAASYSNIRRFINDGQLPPPGAVRIEEMINYFSYQYPQPTNNDPFTVNMEYSSCPWNTTHGLVLVGLQGKKIPVDNLPPSNLVFLVDVSGSMEEPDKLPLVQASLLLLTDQLRPQDKVAIVVYAGSAGLVLPSTNGDATTTIKDAIRRLQAGGSTAGGAGIQLAYATARNNFREGGNNRVILCTDGDFNVGLSSDDALVRMIEEERKSGVFLTVLGFGTGNYQDHKMQQLADKGNGNHAYIDDINEAKKVLINEFGGTLFTIAKDVKLQLEFNPDKVKAYRLIGYENRLLAKEDFNNDKKDAGELGSGHTVTALYEIIPASSTENIPDSVDALRYQKTKQKITNTYTDELMHVKLRYKQPADSTSKLLQASLADKPLTLDKASANFRFAASVAGFGMLLRGSEHKGSCSYSMVMNMAKQALGEDKEGYRNAFVHLVENAALLKGEKATAKE